VLEVLYHHATFGGARISPAAGAAKSDEGTPSFVPSSVPNFTPIGAMVRGGIGAPKLKFLLRFDQNVEYKAPHGSIPCAIFTKFAEFVPRFRMH